MIQIGLFIFPGMTQLDFSGPYEVFNLLPQCQLQIIAKSLEPVQVDGGLRILPDCSFDTARDVDILFVPGGPGVNTLMTDLTTLTFLRQKAAQARYITSVCTGSLLLGAAGLLKGYAATTHWLVLDLLKTFQAKPVVERVVIDRNRITGAGVTSGIDFALHLVALITDATVAQKIQLLLEYDPMPPFSSGSPKKADTEIVAAVTSERSHAAEKRKSLAEQAAQLFCNKD